MELENIIMKVKRLREKESGETTYSRGKRDAYYDVLAILGYETIKEE